MPTPVYRALMSFDGVDALQSTPSATDFGTICSVYFSAGDSSNTWGIEARLNYYSYVDGSGTHYEYRSEYYFYLNAGGAPNTWTLVSGVSSQFEADGRNGAAFKGINTLKITKDYDNDDLMFTTNLGTVTKSLATFVKDTSVLRPACQGGEMTKSNLSTGDQHFKVDFFSFFGTADNTPFLGASLFSSDPGIWGATSVTGTPVLLNNAETQLASRWELEWTWTNANGARNTTYIMRCWAGGDNLTPVQILELDAAVDPSSGFLYVACADFGDSRRIAFNRSDDDGATFSNFTIVSDATRSYKSPSVVVMPNEEVIVFWQDGDEAKLWYSRSANYGETWSAPAFLDVINPPLEFPKVRVHPTSGHVYLFFHQPSNDRLVFQRYDVLLDPASVSLDPAGTTVDTGVVVGLFWDVNFTARGEIVITYVAGSTRTTARSNNWGQVWEIIDASRSGEFSQQSVFDTDGGLSHTIYQDGSGNLYAYRSEDMGVTKLNTDVLIIAAIDFQAFALVQGPRRQLYAVFLGGSPASIFVWRSENLGIIWTAA